MRRLDRFSGLAYGIDALPKPRGVAQRIIDPTQGESLLPAQNCANTKFNLENLLHIWCVAAFNLSLLGFNRKNRIERRQKDATANHEPQPHSYGIGAKPPGIASPRRTHGACARWSCEARSDPMRPAPRASARTLRDDRPVLSSNTYFLPLGRTSLPDSSQ